MDRFRMIEIENLIYEYLLQVEPQTDICSYLLSITKNDDEYNHAISYYLRTLN